MYKRIDFTQLEGLGFTQDTLDFLQTSYREALGSVASILGDYVIISGAAVSGPNYTDGWVAINGELLPFTGGLIAPNIIIEETSANELFADGANKPVYYTRRAKLASSGGTAYSSFVRLDSLKVLKAAIASEATARANADALKVNKSGDTMTGNLTIPASTSANHAVNRSELFDGGVFKTKVIAIGDWNMDSTVFVSIAHGLTQANIRSIAISIRNNSGDLRAFAINEIDDLLGGDSGVLVNSSNINIVRKTGGVYDSSLYNSTSFNRGWIVITFQ
jgi:hypothetical protein